MYIKENNTGAQQLKHRQIFISCGLDFCLFLCTCRIVCCKPVENTGNWIMKEQNIVVLFALLPFSTPSPLNAPLTKWIPPRGWLSSICEVKFNLISDSGAVILSVHLNAAFFPVAGISSLSNLLEASPLNDQPSMSDGRAHANTHGTV